MNFDETSEIIRRMRQACEVKNNAQLARFLNINSSNVTSWCRVKRPPLLHCLKVHKMTGRDFFWILEGEKAEFSADQTQSSAFLNAFMNTIELGEKLKTLKRARDVSDAELRRLGSLMLEALVPAGELIHLDDETELSANVDAEEKSSTDKTGRLGKEEEPLKKEPLKKKPPKKEHEFLKEE